MAVSWCEWFDFSDRASELVNLKNPENHNNCKLAKLQLEKDWQVQGDVAAKV